MSITNQDKYGNIVKDHNNKKYDSGIKLDISNTFETNTKYGIFKLETKHMNK